MYKLPILWLSKEQLIIIHKHYQLIPNKQAGLPQHSHKDIYL